MLNIKAMWKTHANKKEVTAQDTITYCLLRAMEAKNPNKEEQAKRYLLKAFTPISKLSKLERGGQLPFQAIANNIYAVKWGHKCYMEQCLETNEEVSLFVSLVKYVLENVSKWEDKTYSYFVVRQDMTPEQQVVQTAHVAACMARDYEDFNPYSQHFVVLGVSDGETLTKFLNEINQKFSKIKFSVFQEEDLNNEVTAIAFAPERKSWFERRGLFNNWPLLKFSGTKNALGYWVDYPLKVA